MSKNWITHDGIRRAITLTAVTVCVGSKPASENSCNPKYPIFRD